MAEDDKEVGTENSQGVKGFRVLLNPALNKSTAFTLEERERLGIRGLLPATVSSQEMQIQRVLANLDRLSSDIDRYILLLALLRRNERLFYRALIDHIDRLLPLVYTPTVGEACKQFATIFRQARGFYVTPNDRGEIRKLLDNWPNKDVRVIVVTDGERILGLGDLGANGMGIPIGKLTIYTAAAGFHPSQCLPVQLDVGTDNEELRNDPMYLGITKPRLRGPEYDALIEEFIEAVHDAYPHALVQFEDFVTPNAFALLHRYRDRLLCFNDDIQGTACVVLSGVLAAARATNQKFEDFRIVFLGAGSAATGIADLIVEALLREGLSEKEALSRLWFLDSKGLIVTGRKTLKPHTVRYAKDHEPLDFLDTLREVKPHVLIGATGMPGTFSREALEIAANSQRRPIVFALSNPTSRAECTAEEAYEWSENRAVFASGSPFKPVAVAEDDVRHPSQANNAYVFPGIGLGAVHTESTTVTDDMFLAAARALADFVTEEDMARGSLFPPLQNIREVSLKIGTAVAEQAYEGRVAQLPRPRSLRDHLAEQMYDPTY